MCICQYTKFFTEMLPFRGTTNFPVIPLALLVSSALCNSVGRLRKTVQVISKSCYDPGGTFRRIILKSFTNYLLPLEFILTRSLPYIVPRGQNGRHSRESYFSKLVRFGINCFLLTHFSEVSNGWICFIYYTSNMMLYTFTFWKRAVKV